MEMIYTAVKFLTFPGAVLKAFFEHLACRAFEVPSEDVRPLQRNELCGHIEHELTKGKGSFGICFLPFFMSLVFGIASVLPAAIDIVYIGDYNVMSFIMLYFGISFLTNMFPLTEDAYAMWESLYGADATAKMPAKILLAIPAAIMFAGAWLERHAISFLTSVAFSVGLPYLVSLFIK